MRFQLTTLLLASSAALATASPTWQSFQDWAKGSGGKSAPPHTSPRRDISYHPKQPHLPPPNPPPRNKVCYVNSHNDGVTDDSTYILSALHQCNNGGHVVFKEGTEYFIGTALDLTFLRHIDIGKNSAFHLLSDTNKERRHPRICSLLQRYRLLASKQLPICLPERHIFLQARRRRCKHLRRRHSRRQWSDLV